MTGRTYMGIPREQIPWFPVINPDKCTNCGSCIDFCNNNVFEAGEKATVVVNPYNCVVGCHSCQRICEFDAITFPTQESLIKILKDLRT